MSADNAYAVELKGLSFKRGTRSIFNNVDIRIPRGKVTGIMGPSGSGKTTLLRLMGAQLRPSSGEVWVNGQNLGQDPIAMGVLVRLIRLLNDALGITSVVVSHDLAETASIADYLYVVGDGQVLGQGTPQELMQSDNPRIRQFMTGDPDGPVPFHYPAPDYREDLLGKR
jgi:ABC-type transporter Mla maintaining outer membrane lipid asymmetry ATPase subunit MlaF